MENMENVLPGRAVSGSIKSGAYAYGAFPFPSHGAQKNLNKGFENCLKRRIGSCPLTTFRTKPLIPWQD